MANIRTRLEKLEALLLQKKADPATPAVEDHRSPQVQYEDLINAPLSPQYLRRCAAIMRSPVTGTVDEAKAAYLDLIGEPAEAKRTTVTIAPPGAIQ